MTTDLLLRSPLFAAMPRAAVDGLAARATRRKVRAGQRLRGADLWLVLTGRLEIRAGDDEVVVIRSLVPPAVAGISGCCSGGRSTVTG